VLGTDGAIGKRTTSTVLAQALTDVGLRTVLVGTSQPSLIQGARYGVALDAVTRTHRQVAIGAEVRFRPGYSALLRAMSTPTVSKHYSDARELRRQTTARR
jgi:predicted GTPase